MISPHDILKIISDMAARGEEPTKIAKVYERLKNGREMPPDIQQEAFRIMAGQMHLEKIIFKENVRKLMLSITGVIDIREVRAFFDARKEEQKWIIYHALQEMESEGLIIRTGNRHGCYRRVDRDSHIMDLDAVDENVADIYLPLLLHTMVEIYPKNIILVSGEKDAGKTCFSLNVGYENRDRYSVHYFNSEMGTMELRRRLAKFPTRYKLEEWKKITWHEQAKNFEDHIDKDGLNIIDFLEVGSEAFAVTEDIRKVFDKLDKGLLLIVMQKRSYKEFAVGGEGTLEKARLAINLEHKGNENLARITVAKNWKTNERPRHKVCKYKIVQGGEMQMDGSWHYPEQAEAAGAKASPKGFTKRSANVYNLGTAAPDFPREI